MTTQEDWTLDQFTSAIGAGGIALWSWHPGTGGVVLDALGRRFWGVGEARQSLDTLFARVDAEARAETRTAWLDSAHSDGPYDFSFPITVAGRTRWIAARGEGVHSNLPDDTVVAVFIDITAQKAAEQAQRTLVREMVHRIGNLFGVASSVTALAARSTESVAELSADLQARFTKLRTGFTYAVRGDRAELQPVPVAALLRELLTPHDDAGDRIAIDVPDDLMLASDRIVNMAMIVHELATNAVKYGALGAAGGRVDIAMRSGEGRRTLVWTERGGPRIDRLPDATGFGTRLLDHTLRTDFGGDMERCIAGGGLKVTMRMAASAFET